MRSFAVAIEGYLERQEKEHRARVWLAWHIEGFARVKKLPDLNRMLGVEVIQDPDEMLEELDRWVNLHNAVQDVKKAKEAGSGG